MYVLWRLGGGKGGIREFDRQVRTRAEKKRSKVTA
jgi:hypothetical protein